MFRISRVILFVFFVFVLFYSRSRSGLGGQVSSRAFFPLALVWGSSQGQGLSLALLHYTPSYTIR